MPLGTAGRLGHQYSILGHIILGTDVGLPKTAHSPYTLVIHNIGLNRHYHSSNEAKSSMLATLMLAEQVDSEPFDGSDYYSEVERRLQDKFKLPPYFIQQIKVLFAGPKNRLNRGL